MSQLTEVDINRVVTAFYGSVRQDDLLAPIFATKINDEDWPRHMAHISDFWSSIFLKTGRFKGSPMMKHLALSGITPAHFERWLDLFKKTAEVNLQPEQATEFTAMANRIAESFQMGLAFHYDKAGQKDHAFTQYGLRAPQRIKPKTF